ncbi:phage lysis protein [Pectobacterium aquaticum]|uniref:Phage lysis protein n=1 Tax=Pectobacterium aquaticum TaxID=2204145 RepID=A0A426IM04_9GAMM|nr:phage lysis protein [Pectobacterium aquaticum]
MSADNRQLESALVSCALQVETIKHCQEKHHAETQQPAPRPE